MQIQRDDLSHPAVIALLHEHLKDMRTNSPPESVHALDLDALRKPDVTFWTVWKEDQVAGCGALKELDSNHGEIKSMRTSGLFRRRGVAVLMLKHIVDEARTRQYQRLSLETGAQDFFKPAHALYAAHGFEVCGPFANYKNDPNSVFMTLSLDRR